MIQAATRYGLILGIIMTVYSALLYMMGVEVFSNFWLYLILYPVVIFCMVFFTIKIRKNLLEGKMTFLQGFLSSFVIGGVSGIIPVIWGLLLFNVIDPELKTTMPEIIILQTEEMMTNWGAPQSQIDETLEQQAIEIPKQFTVSGQIMSFFKGLIFYAVIAAIVGLITKKAEGPAASLDLV